VILFVTMRVVVSTTFPGAYGISIRIGFVGYFCAAAGNASGNASNKIVSMRIIHFSQVSDEVTR